jgi:ABC-type nitrate/sulfonate/bicarbonate transport system ATPase subunit
MIEIKEPILEVKGLNLYYDKKHILRDINFSVNNITRVGVTQGQVVSLIGRSGIGKTQLFKLISGLNKPNTGSVLIDSDLHPVTSGEVGIVSQNYILFNHRTIVQNLELALKKNKTKHIEFGTAKDSEIINFYADKFDLSAHLTKYPYQLSGGQRQRTSIVQQLLTGNKFILFDEPFSGLDCIMIEKVMNTLLKVSLQNEYNTLVIISHDLENSLSISDSAYILAKEEGKEGATIVKSYNLINMNIAYRQDNKESHDFRELIKEIKTII